MNERDHWSYRFLDRLTGGLPAPAKLAVLVALLFGLIVLYAFGSWSIGQFLGDIAIELGAPRGAKTALTIALLVIFGSRLIWIFAKADLSDD